MEIQRAIEVGEREWENIRVSLEMCGNIGEFDSKSHINIGSTRSEDLLLVRNLIYMDNKFSTHRYLTPEAAYVFTILVSMAAERLGLMGESGQNFGSGYSLIRTGCFISNGTEEQRIKQAAFLKLFFPIGGGFNWKFHSSLVKTRLKSIFDKFVEWQSAAGIYIENAGLYESQQIDLI
ncbi:MAG: hypothetical protein C4291_03070 [Candidatus Dadabacteria bacterium]